ncbi:MAG: hypothetical protein U1A77_18995 [Pirellulales bacterium]
MDFRQSVWRITVIVWAAMLLAPTSAWAVYFPLSPSSDDWGMKYEIVLSDMEEEQVNVTFTLTNAGRLTPIHSATVVAFSQPLSDGGRSYLVKVALDLKVASDGSARAEVLIPKKHVEKCKIRILTLHVDGRRQTAGAAYYDLPLKKPAKEKSVAKKSKKPKSSDQE